VRKKAHQKPIQSYLRAAARDVRAERLYVNACLLVIDGGALSLPDRAP
jgi:hypothetical protein